MMALKIVSAAPFEIEMVLKEFPTIDYLPCGIGPLEAAFHAAKLREACRGHDVLFLGSCGTFSHFQKPYLITSQTTMWLSYAQRVGKGYLVGSQNDSQTCTLLDQFTLNLPQKTVICDSTISLEKALPQEFNPEDLVENLELFSVASFVAGAAKTFSPILGVTNEIGPQAHDQWLKFHKCIDLLLRDHMLACQ